MGPQAGHKDASTSPGSFIKGPERSQSTQGKTSTKASQHSSVMGNQNQNANSNGGSVSPDLQR